MLNSLASAVRGERQRKFMAAVSTAFHLFQIRVSDMLLLFSFGQCVATQLILHRHSASLVAADLAKWQPCTLCASKWILDQPFGN